MKASLKFIIFFSFILTLFIWVMIYGQIKLYKAKPSISTWSKLHSIIYQQSKPNDSITFDPGWLVGYATDLSKFNFLDIVSSYKIFQEKTVLPERLWFVTLREKSSKLNDLLEFKYKAVNSFDFESLNVLILERKDIIKTFSFNSNLTDAKAFIIKNKEAEEGLFRTDKFVFKSNDKDWNAIKVVSKSFSFRQERQNSIQFHPVKDGIKAIEYKNLPESDLLNVLVYLADSGRRYDSISSVQFSILINGEEKEKVKIDENNSEQLIKIHLLGSARSISFNVVSLNNDIEKRHIMFSGFLSKNSNDE